MLWAMMQNIKNSGAVFPSFASDITGEDEVCAGGGHEPPRPVACESLWRMMGVPGLLTGDWAIL